MKEIEIAVTCGCGCQASAQITGENVDQVAFTAAFIHAAKGDGWRLDDERGWLCPTCSGKPRDKEH